MQNSEFNVGDLVLIFGADAVPVQGIVQSVDTTRIVTVKTATDTRTIFTTGLLLVSPAKV